MSDRPAPPARPVALGCTLAVAAVALVILVAVLGVIYIESGADTGEAVLDPVGAYAPGTVSFVPAEHLFVVRTPAGDLLVVGDLDRGQREARQLQCRVAPLLPGDPSLARLLDEHGDSLSADAAGTQFLFREGCSGAVYDLAGVRLDADGPNLDRYAVSVDDAGRVVVDLQDRTCTRREGVRSLVEEPCNGP